MARQGERTTPRLGLVRKLLLASRAEAFAHICTYVAPSLWKCVLVFPIL